MEHLNPQQQTLASLVAAKTGFEAGGLSPQRLEALTRTLRKEGCPEGGEPDFPRLEELAAEAISVGETYFYRQAEHFEFLLGRALEMQAGEGPFLAWSAGCSSGEEAWSMAACLRDALDGRRTLEVLGTDMSSRNLKLAAEGRYGKWSLRRESQGLPEVLRGRGEELEVLPSLRPLVRFERANLLDPPPLEGRKANLIFCRNVLIYLRPEASRQVIRHLVEAMAEGAWLILGSVDIDFAPPGLVPEEPRVLQIWRKPAPVARAAKPEDPAPEAPPAEPAADPGPVHDPKADHLAALHLQEQGDEAGALQALLALRVKRPDYLPGLFDLALALSRRGAKREAAATLEALLEAADGRDPMEQVDAPEPVSLTFYITSAQAFLDRYGKNL